MKFVQIGVLLPSRETAMTDRHDATGLVQFARDAEAAGFDSVWTGDSPMARKRVEPLALLAAVSAATSTVTIGTAAFTAALRHPFLSAHSISTVDQLSRGRLVVGVGGGFPMPDSEAEFAAVGVPFDGRIRRLDDTVQQWRALWNDPERALPPHQTGGPPVWLAGGDSPRVIERAAARYDGWLPYLPNPDAYAAAWAALSERAGELGRTVTPGLYATVSLDPDRDALDCYCLAYYGLPLELMSSLQGFVGGSAGECAERLAAYVAAGARHIVLRIGAVDARTQLDAVAELVRQVRS